MRSEAGTCWDDNLRDIVVGSVPVRERGARSELSGVNVRAER